MREEGEVDGASEEGVVEVKAAVRRRWNGRARRASVSVRDSPMLWRKETSSCMHRSGAVFWRRRASVASSSGAGPEEAVVDELSEEGVDAAAAAAVDGVVVVVELSGAGVRSFAQSAVKTFHTASDWVAFEGSAAAAARQAP